MNSFKGIISEIKVNQDMSLVSIDMGHNIHLRTIIIETPATASYLKLGNSIKVLFKETEVVLGLGTMGQVSLQNKIEGTVVSIVEGALISKVNVTTPLGEIVSIISAKAVEDLNIMKGLSVTAMVKLNEIMLAE